MRKIVFWRGVSREIVEWKWISTISEISQTIRESFPNNREEKAGRFRSLGRREERKPISRIVRVREYHLGLGIILNFYINYSKERGRWPMSAGKNIG